jgi:hypothetical protein
MAGRADFESRIVTTPRPKEDHSKRNVDAVEETPEGTDLSRAEAEQLTGEDGADLSRPDMEKILGDLSRPEEENKKMAKRVKQQHDADVAEAEQKGKVPYGIFGTSIATSGPCAALLLGPLALVILIGFTYNAKVNISQKDHQRLFGGIEDKEQKKITESLLNTDNLEQAKAIAFKYLTDHNVTNPEQAFNQFLDMLQKCKTIDGTEKYLRGLKEQGTSDRDIAALIAARDEINKLVPQQQSQSATGGSHTQRLEERGTKGAKTAGHGH